MPSRRARLRGLLVAEQADLEVERAINHRAIGLQPAVGDAEHQFGAHHPLEVDAVHDLFHGWQHLARELDFTHTERTTFARGTQPAEKEAEHLPQGIEPEAARHHRIALEMAREEPQVRLELE